MESAADRMQTVKTLGALNELLRITCRSLPAYLADARPWTQSSDHGIQTALDHLVADQQRYARRLSDAITSCGGRPDPGRYAMEFTSKHDLALDFLRHDVICHQELDIAAIQRCAIDLEDMPQLHSLAEEILGNAKGHLEVLKEMQKDE